MKALLLDSTSEKIAQWGIFGMGLHNEGWVHTGFIGRGIRERDLEFEIWGFRGQDLGDFGNKNLGNFGSGFGEFGGWVQEMWVSGISSVGFESWMIKRGSLDEGVLVRWDFLGLGLDLLRDGFGFTGKM